MPKAKSPAADQPQAAPETRMSRHDAALQDHETNPRYWLFRRDGEIHWVNETGSQAAKDAVGDHDVKAVLLYRTAGEALRVAEQQSEAMKFPIVNLSGLEAAAKADPEPDSGAKTAWAAKKAAK